MKLTPIDGRKWPSSTFNLLDANFPFDLKVKGFFLLLLELMSQTGEGEVKWSESHSVMSDPMDHTVDGILQARILEWVAFPFSRGSSQPRDRTQVSRIADRFFTSWAYYIFCKWKLTGGIILTAQKCANGK